MNARGEARMKSAHRDRRARLGPRGAVPGSVARVIAS